jgi:hypothetical protein
MTGEIDPANSGLQEERRKNPAFVITEAQLKKATYDSAQNVARRHRWRLTFAVFFAAMAVSCGVAYVIGRVVSHDAQARSVRTCHVLQDVASLATAFVTSDTQLRTQSAAVFDAPAVRAVLLRLYSTPALGNALIAQAALSKQYASYWATLARRLEQDAQANCLAIGG